jgi:hypothetical protein
MAILKLLVYGYRYQLQYFYNISLSCGLGKDDGFRKNPRIQGVKLPAQGRASREGSFVHIVPLDPACKAGLARHVPAKWSRVLVKVGSFLEPSNP